MNSAREILTAQICEEDILNGRLTNDTSYLKYVAYKLTTYAGALQNPFHEKGRFSDREYADYLNSSGGDGQDIISKIFEAYRINCSNIHNIEAARLDALIEEYTAKQDLDILNQIISLVRNAHISLYNNENDIVNKICDFIIKHLEDSCSLEDIANALHFSKHYLRHLFKKATGVSIVDFKIAQRIKKAKLLLKTGDFKIMEIAEACGFETSSYFSEVFMKEVGVSPKDYRKMLKQP